LNAGKPGFGPAFLSPFGTGLEVVPMLAFPSFLSPSFAGSILKE
jgi:hypothetical protein